VRAREKASMTRAAAWLEELGPGQYAQVFARQSTAVGVISDLTEVNLQSFGHRERMLSAIGSAEIPPRRLARADEVIE
jgi:hypothetical protein